MQACITVEAGSPVQEKTTAFVSGNSSIWLSNLGLLCMSCCFSTTHEPELLPTYACAHYIHTHTTEMTNGTLKESLKNKTLPPSIYKAPIHNIMKAHDFSLFSNNIFLFSGSEKATLSGHSEAGTAQLSSIKMPGGWQNSASPGGKRI